MKRLTTDSKSTALRLCLLLLLAASSGSAIAALIDSNNSNFNLTADLELVGGIYINDHLKEGTAGRENQIKMTRALVGLGLNKGSWESSLELVGIGDEVYQDPDDRAYLDIYRNLGAMLEKVETYSLSIEKAFESGFSLRAFYRQDDVPYLTMGDKELEERAGLVFSYYANL